MSTTSTLNINPTKFTIYDSDLSDCSSSEIDEDEWVTISSSSTTSTTSTLPRYLVHQPKISPSKQLPVRSRSNALSASSPSTTRSATDASAAKDKNDPPTLADPEAHHNSPMQTSRSDNFIANISQPIQTTTTSSHERLQTETRTQNTTRPKYSPTSILHTHIPSLTAIYLTSPTSCTASLTTTPTSSHLRTLLPANSPSPIQFHSPAPALGRSWGSATAKQETYLRVCSACFLPNPQRPFTIYCDGTWASSLNAPSGVCSVHASTFGDMSLQAWLTSHLPFGLAKGNGNRTTAMGAKVWRWKNETSALQSMSGIGWCVHGPGAVCPGCPSPASMRTVDEAKELLGAIIDAVAPLDRGETETEGVRVFDMTVPTAREETYVHKKGCGCVQKNIA